MHLRTCLLHAILAASVAACSSSQESTPGSGGSGNAGGSGSGGASGEVVLLAEGEVPTSLTVFGAHVLWTDVHWEGSVRTAVVNRVPRVGGAVVRVAERGDAIDFLGIASSDGRVHWVGYGQGVPGALFSAPASGLEPMVVAPDQGAPIAIAQSSERLAWINLSPGAAMSYSGGSVITLAADPQDSASCVALAGSDVVWLSHNGTPRISRVGADAASLLVVTEGSAGGPINCVAADAEHVYFTRAGTWSDDFEPTYHHDGAVHRVPLEGGEPELLASEQEQPHGIALRGGHVYWLNHDGALRRVATSGGEVEELVPPGTAANAPRTQTVVTDADGVYWISGSKVWALLNP
jgi:sugar lactone lactonase YvrE